MISVKLHGLKAVRCKAFLNGEELVNRCFAADPIEGWADCFVLSGDTLATVVLDEFGEPKTERLYGQVRIEAIE